MKQAYDEGVYIKNDTESAFHCLLHRPKRKGIISEAHYHNYMEILYGADCDLKVWVNDETYRLGSGDLIVINSRETHAVISDIAENSYYVIKFFPEVLKNDTYISREIKYMTPVFGRDFSAGRLICKNEIEKTDIDRIIKQIYREWENSSFGYEMALRGGSLMLYAQMARIWSKNTDYFYPVDETAKNIRSAADYAAAHFSDITEEEVAERFCMSYSYFSRMFKKVMKKSFTAFINEQRLDHGRRLLLTTNLPITQIAQDAGFSSSSHFIYNFKKMTGYSPLEYRKLLTKE